MHLIRNVFIVILSSTLLFACSVQKKEVLNRSFYNDEESRKNLFENGNEPKYNFVDGVEEIWFKYYLTVQNRGVPLPYVHVLKQNNKMIKALDQEYNLVYEVTEKENLKIAKTSLVDQAGVIYDDAQEIAYYDDFGQIYKVEGYDSEGNQIAEYTIEGSSLYVNTIYQEDYRNCYTKNENMVFAYKESILEGNTIRELLSSYIIDENGRLIQYDSTNGERKNFERDGRKLTSIDNEGNIANYDNGYNIKYFYDNNGYIIKASYSLESYVLNTFYVYDFKDRKVIHVYYDNESIDTSINELIVNPAGLLVIELFKEFGVEMRINTFDYSDEELFARCDYLGYLY